MQLLRTIVICTVFGFVAVALPTNNLELTIVHFNDFHARFAEQSPTSGVCKPGNICHGGFARLYESIMGLMNTTKNPILLNAGDNFQGTLWYNMFKWNVTQYFLNMLPTKANTIGNHEFDDKIQGLVPFLKALKAPTVVCNLNDSLVPEIQGLYKKSITFDVDGKKIAIVGVALASTPEISSTGALGFLDEVQSVNAEVERLVREENIFTAIVLSHAGYYIDQQMAKMGTAKISLIVGGHTHTFLNNGTGEDGSYPEGTYPTLIKRDLDGQVVPIVQAACYTRYLGNLKLVIGPTGEALSWDGQPIFLAPTLPKNPKIVELLKPWQDQVTIAGEQVFGSTDVLLEAETCRFEECNLGNFLTDAMVYTYKHKAVGDAWTYASLAIMNSGGIRASIPIGNITYNDLITTQPFSNTFDIGLLQGKYIKDFLERTASPTKFKDIQTNVQLLQLSGFKVVYDLSKSIGERVVELQLLCADCTSPQYEVYDPMKDYRIVVPSFIATGGDGYTIISENLRNYTVGPLDIDVFREYVPKASPIKVGVEGRMTFVGKIKPRRKTLLYV